MTTSITSASEKITRLVNDYLDDRYCLVELLVFLGNHPDAKFNQLAIVHALDSRKLYIERALRYLISHMVVKTYIEGNATLYSLIEDEAIRKSVLDLVTFHQWQQQILLPENDNMSSTKAESCSIIEQEKVLETAS